MTCITSLVLMLAAAPGWAAEGWVELPGADIEFPDDSEWISLPNGALRDRDSGVLAVPLLMIEEGIPANSSERETMARALAGSMAEQLTEDYEDVTYDTVMRDDSFAMLLSGYGPSSLHGGERALTLISVVATPSWVGALTLVVPQSDLAAQSERADRIVRTWRRPGVSPSSWDSRQLFSMESPAGFVLESRVSSVASLLRYADGATLTVVSVILRPRSARGRLGIGSVVAGLESVEGIDTDQITERPSEYGMIYELHQVVRRGPESRQIDLLLRLVETPDRSAGFLMFCNDGLCDSEDEVLDAAFETFEWR
jgi:hypothetical protein